MTAAVDIPAAPVVPRSFEAERREFAIRQTWIGCILVLICMPLGLLLDAIVYPEKLLHFFVVARLGCDLAVLPLVVLLWRGGRERHIGWIALVWPLVPAVAISYMIAATDGGASTYYAGLILVLIVACLLMPYRMAEALLVCGAVMAIYLAACGIHRALAETSGTSVRPLLSNFYFLFLTSVICVASAASHSRRRVQEHALRQRVAEANDELSEANGQLQASYEKLSELDRMKNDFFANISHEFRTPLTLILSPVEDLLEDGERFEDDDVETLRLVRGNAMRLLRLINDLLEVVRLDEAKLSLQRSPIELGPYLSGLVDSVRHHAGRKGLTVTADGATGLIASIDPSRFERVVLNILSNAIKFTPAGGSIEVSWARDDGEALIRITDTGCGIPEADIPHIFDRIHQVDASQTREYTGVGIGLALAQELMHAHGGSVSATSAVGTGTTFTVRMPLAAAGIEADNHAAPRVASSDDPMRDLLLTAPAAKQTEPVDADERKPLVLVADDEPDMRRFIAGMLRPRFEVIEVIDGVQALEAIDRRPPDLIVLDLMMPRLDGRGVTLAVRERNLTPEPKILLLTAREDQMTKLQLLRDGVDDFLTKPFSSAELRTRVSNIVARGRLERDLATRNDELAETLEKLKAVKLQLIQSVKMNGLGKLAAGLLHEINNPLNYMNMAVELALDMTEDNPQLRETIGDLRDGVQQIKSVTGDLHAFAHPSTKAHTETFPLVEAVKVATRLASVSLDGCEVSTDGLDVLVDAPRSQLVQVLTNLLVNAAQATDDVEPRFIAVHANRKGGRVVVEVRDSGPGIDEEIQNRVLEPFFTTKDVGKGTGLGLSICHTIVAQWEGSLQFRKTPECFIVAFDIPSAQSDADAVVDYNIGAAPAAARPADQTAKPLAASN